MNRINTIVHVSMRSYRTSRGGRSSVSRRAAASRFGEMAMPDSEVLSKNFGVDVDNDFEDIDEYDSDFQNVGKYDKMHEREMQIQKAKLKTQIVKRKYFKCEDPPMLTWAEKEQIRLLHAEDPIEWSADRLCESFPATRDAILKVLRSKWSPKNVKTVTKYDEAAKKNWELYRAGKLIVSAELRVRLDKFKDRKIELMEEKEIAKRFIKPKPTFRKPKSTLFSNIIQSYLDANPECRDNNDDDSVSNERMPKESLNQITSGDSTTINDRRVLGVTTRVDKMARNQSLQQPLTFNEFLKHRVENVQSNDMTPVDRVLVDEYKHRKTEAYKAETFVFESESPVGISKEMKKLTLSDDGADTRETTESTKILTKSTMSGEKTDLIGVDKIERRDKNQNSIVVDKVGPETGIIARHKKNDSLHSDYPEYIKIPAKKYKPGVTYRVEDRYYDDDGEFLYRVTGLKS